MSGTAIPKRFVGRQEESDGRSPAGAQARSTQLAVDTADRIRDLIVSGQYQPGHRLPPERVLAKQLGVSRGALREAISQLAALNILSARQGAGTFVALLSADALFAPLDFALQVDPHSLLHLYELRRIFEPVGASLAAARITPAALDQLRAYVDEYNQVIHTGRIDRLIEIDEAIHLAVASASGNPLLTAILRSISESSHRARLITSAVPTTPPATQAELNALVSALVARDPLRSEAAMLRHLSRLEETARLIAQERGSGPES